MPISGKSHVRNDDKLRSNEAPPRPVDRGAGQSEAFGNVHMKPESSRISVSVVREDSKLRQKSRMGKSEIHEVEVETYEAPASPAAWRASERCSKNVEATAQAAADSRISVSVVRNDVKLPSNSETSKPKVCENRSYEAPLSEVVRGASQQNTKKAVQITANDKSVMSVVRNDVKLPSNPEVSKPGVCKNRPDEAPPCLSSRGAIAPRSNEVSQFRSENEVAVRDDVESRVINGSANAIRNRSERTAKPDEVENSLSNVAWARLELCLRDELGPRLVRVAT